MTSSGPRVQSLFGEALDIESAADRAAFLERACGSDAALRASVEALLAAHQGAGRFLDPNGAHPPVETPGTVVGPYTLRERIGEGGMGVVFVAEQAQPVRRKVALKLIKPGMDSRQVIARFEAERQALALMDHPHIAKVFDAGTTDSGRPFFVMELVKGVPITDYCDQHRLTMRQRLDLFVQVCQAVQHAHQKGIIHRDLKPSNVLVTVHDVAPVVKVIDFGVAKATAQPLTDKTIYTQLTQMVGTPLYMSPEQAGLSGLDVDTRSDVYSLGVLLYELLTGTTPFEAEALKQAGYDEMRRIIREDEPPRPSARLSTLAQAELSTVAERRGVEPRRLSHEVRGELDWVVMRCLDKDRNRRYETASALARDLDRYLADEVVEARPPSATYRLRKALRRNKGAVLAASLLVLSLVGGVVGTSLGMLRAKAERDRAVDAEADTKAFADFLDKHILAATRPEGVLGGVGANVTMAQALLKAEPALEAVFRGRPKAEALARHAIGVTWRNLGRYSEAARHLERALELREEVFGPDHPDTMTTMHHLALAYLDAGQRVVLRSPYAKWIKEKGVPLFERALTRCRETLGPDHLDTLTAMSNLASAYQATWRLKAMNSGTTFSQAASNRDETVRLLEHVLVKLQERQGPDHHDTLVSMNNLAMAYWAAGKRDKGQLLLEQTLAKTEKLGRDHPDTLSIMNNLASVYKDSGQPEKAVSLFEQALLGRNRKLGPDHASTQRSMEGLARAYLVVKQPEKALPLLRDFLAGQKKRLGDDDPRLASLQATVAMDLLKAGWSAEAEPILRECLAAREKIHTPDEWMTFHTRSLLGAALLGQKKYADAEPLLLAGYEGLKQVDDKLQQPYIVVDGKLQRRDRGVHGRLVPLNQHELWLTEWFHRARVTEALERLVQLYEATGKTDEATRWQNRLQEHKKRMQDNNAPGRP